MRIGRQSSNQMATNKKATVQMPLPLNYFGPFSYARPLDYESRALPLSYSGRPSDALARIRTATPFGTTPSR